MKDFILDLKIFHKWVGRYLFKTFIKISATTLSVSLLCAGLSMLITATAIPWLFVAFTPLAVVLASIIAYFTMFLDDRGEIKEVKKEVYMKRKYPSLFTKFNKTF